MRATLSQKAISSGAFAALSFDEFMTQEAQVSAEAEAASDKIRFRPLESKTNFASEEAKPI